MRDEGGRAEGVMRGEKDGGGGRKDEESMKLEKGKRTKNGVESYKLLKELDSK